MKKLHNKLFLFFFSFLLVFFAHTAIAANLNLSPSSGSYKVGDTINVRVVLSSPTQSANAISTTIDFPRVLLTLNSISKIGSRISLWAVEPSFSNGNGTATMEGVILNGYTGSNGTIATLSFKAKAAGNANIKFTTSSVLANDGQGTEIISGTGQANFTITQAETKTTVTTPSTKTTSSITIEELKKKNGTDSFATFLISNVGKRDKSSYKIGIDGITYPWEDQESSIFETPTLPKGNHTLNVSMNTINLSLIHISEPT